jgi:hypothetical protein
MPRSSRFENYVGWGCVMVIFVAYDNELVVLLMMIDPARSWGRMHACG